MTLGALLLLAFIAPSIGWRRVGREFVAEFCGAIWDVSCEFMHLSEVMVDVACEMTTTYQRRL